MISTWVWLLLALASLALAVRSEQAARQVSVVVAWTTASELNTAGFNLYRAPNEEGPFERINDQLIPAAPDPLTGGEYEYVDREVQAGETYTYQLAEVETDGTEHVLERTQAQAESGGRLAVFLYLALLGVALVSLILQRRALIRREA
jgi:hypothetical protein